MNWPDTDGKLEQKLPIEIILRIIELVIPPNSGTIFPSSDVATRTLLALTHLCRATYRLASRLLRQHCMYIDSSRKLLALVRTLGGPNDPSLASGGAGSIPSSSSLDTPTRMYLSPFDETEDSGDGSQADLELPAETGSAANDRAEPEDESDSSFFFSPLDDPATAMAVRDLLIAVAPTLRRLVIDMPLRSLYPEDDHQNVRPFLREGFSALSNIEEFVSVQDELYLNVHSRGFAEPQVWATCWPKLRFLALYNLDLYNMDPGPRVWERLARLPHLETVVLSRPDGLMEDWMPDRHGIDVKKEWLDALSANASRGEPRRREDITMGFVNVSSELPRFPTHHHRWRETDPEGRIRITGCAVPFPDRDDVDSSEIEATQMFVRQHALDGTLFHGEILHDLS